MEEETLQINIIRWVFPSVLLWMEFVIDESKEILKTLTFEVQFIKYILMTLLGVLENFLNHILDYFNRHTYQIQYGSRK